MLRVLINCPGGWSHGLDSPERGEGRWAQNLARCLAKAGQYNVSACSGGIPTWGRGDFVPNIALLSEQEAGQRGPYDLYFDAAWYQNKRPVTEARANFHVHFGYEPRLGTPFPEGHYLVYVLRRSAPQYVGEGRGNADRTFYLPAPFAERAAAPKLIPLGLLNTLRGSDAPGRRERFEAVYAAVSRLRAQGHEIPFTWIASAGAEVRRHPQDRVLVPDAAWGIPYNEVRAVLRDCGLNTALDGWSNVLDATALGVPSLAWVGGVDGTPAEIARASGLLIEADDPPERVAEVIERILLDKVCRSAYVHALQEAFADHVEAVTLSYFDRIMRSVLK